MTHPSVPRRLALVLLPVLVVALAACGSNGGGGAQVASLNSSGGNSGGLATTTTLSTKQRQDAILSYTACMRSHGVSMKDPTFDANGNMTGGGIFRNSGVDRSSTTFQTAQKACGSLIQGIGFGGGRRGNFDPTKIQAAFNDFTACLRDHGLTSVKDITFGRRGTGGNGGATGTTVAGGGGGVFGGGGGGGSVPPGGFNGPPGGGSRPNDNGNAPGGGGFNPTTRLIEQLGLNASDPKVKSALDACQALITSAFSNGSTTTTVAG